LQILIVYYSEGGHTQKVVNQLEEQLTEQGHDITVRNALTATCEQVKAAEMVLIGTPVHGYILFGQKPAKEVREFLTNSLPEDLAGKPMLGFATYLFFPSGALKPIRKAVEGRNGKIIGLLAERRTKKAILIEQILDAMKKGTLKTS
jgi:flavodoxin